MSTFELRLAVASGDVGAAVRVWREGMECWTPVEELPELGHAVPGRGQWVEGPPSAVTASSIPVTSPAGAALRGASDQASAARDAMPTEPTPTCSPVDVPAAVVAAVRLEPAPAAASSEPFELTATPTLAATPDEAPTQAMLAVRLQPLRALAAQPRTAATPEPLSTPEPSAASWPALGLTVAPRDGSPRARGRFAAAAAALCTIGLVVTAVRGGAGGSSAASQPAAIAHLADRLLASTRRAADTATPVPAPTLERAHIEARPRDPGQKRMRRASAR
ncbi:MAG: GYF domain-containing protein [Polyangiaceae bacterium]